MGTTSRTPRIATPRLLMREWRDDDLEPFARLNADPVVMEHFAEPLGRERSDAFVDLIVRRWRELGYSLWAVERTDTHELIGYVGLWPVTFEAPFAPTVEVGWRLAAEHWGQGFATEAAREAVTFGFEQVGLDEIVSFTATGNVRSWRVMERLGMRREPESDFDHPSVPAGHRVGRQVFYRLTRADWERRDRRSSEHAAR